VKEYLNKKILQKLK